MARPRALDPRTHLGKGYTALVHVAQVLCGPFVADQIPGATSATGESPARDQVGKDWGNDLNNDLALASDREREVEIYPIPMMSLVAEN